MTYTNSVWYDAFPPLGIACLFLVFVLGTVGNVDAQRAPERAETTYTAALKLFHEGLFEQASNAFSSFRNRYPQHLNAPDALYFEAESMMATGREEEAINLFTTFQQRYPVHPLAFQARLALGKHFFEKKDYPRALTTLGDVLVENPPPEDAAKALYWMGESSFHLNRLDEARAFYQRVADEYPNSSTAPAAAYAIAYTEVRQKNYDGAARAFEHLAEHFPGSQYASNIGLALGEVYYELGDYRRTVGEINRRMPNLGNEAKERARFLLAESYNQLRDSQNAIVHYRHFTEGDPNGPYFRRAVYGLAWNYYREKAYQWAAEQFDRAAKNHVDDLAGEATYYAAVNWKMADDDAKALERFAKVPDQWPELEMADHALYELGMTFYQLRRWKEANAAFINLIKSYPETKLMGDALYQAGNTFVALGNFDSALDNFDRAVSLDAAPVSLKQEIVFQKAWLLYRIRDYKKARPAFLALYNQNKSGPRAGEALFWAAESSFQVGKLAESATLFQRYVANFSSEKHIDAAHYALGWAYFKQNNYAQAIPELQQFLDRYRDTSEDIPYRLDAQLRLADSYYALKRFPEAIRIYTQVAAGGEDYALYQIGQAYSNSGDAFQAIITFRKLLVDYPQSDYRQEAQYSLGYLYFQNQEYERAEQEYSSLIEDYPRDPLAAKAQYSIGDALFNAGNFEASVAAYQKVLERYPNSPFVADAATSIQYALIAMDDEERARQIIDDFSAKHPNSPVVDELHFRQAEAKFQSGQTAEARLAFQQFVRTAKSTKLLPEAYYYLGSIYSDAGKEQEAETYLRQVVDKFASSPRQAQAAQRLGDLYLSEKRFNDALGVFQNLEEQHKNDPHLVAIARYGQSRSLIPLGQQARAEQLLREAIAVSPDSPDLFPAKLGLAHLFEGDGRLDRAEELYRDISRQSKDETGAESLYDLGNLEFNRGDPRGALEILSKMPVLFPGFSDWLAKGYLKQADAFLQLGQTGEAARLYDLIIDHYPGTDFADAAVRQKSAL